MDIELISVKSEDDNQVIEILRANALWLESLDILQWPLDWFASIEHEILRSVEEGNYYFVLSGLQQVGVVEILTKPEEIWGFDAAPSLYLHKLAIKRQYAGKGLGRLVISHWENQAANLGKTFLRLDCVAHNFKLRAYYEGLGFKPVGDVDVGIVKLALYQKHV